MQFRMTILINSASRYTFADEIDKGLYFNAFDVFH